MLFLQHSRSITIQLFENNVDSSRSRRFEHCVMILIFNREFCIACIASSLIAWRNNAEVIISTAKCSRFRLITKVTASLRKKFQSLFAKHLNRVHHLLQNLTLRPALWSLLDLYQTGRQREEEESRKHLSISRSKIRTMTLPTKRIMFHKKIC